MQTRNLAVLAVVLAVVPVLVSMGCNKKEDLAPAPSATQAPAPPPPAAPAAVPSTPAAVATTQVHAQAKPVPHTDAGLHDGSAVVLNLPDAGAIAMPTGIPTTLPPIPTLHPSAVAGIASALRGIATVIPTNLIPPPPPPAASH
jgi:hypothetical protein